MDTPKSGQQPEDEDYQKYQSINDNFFDFQAEEDIQHLVKNNGEQQ